jgi:hypothetical protein
MADFLVNIKGTSENAIQGIRKVTGELNGLHAVSGKINAIAGSIAGIFAVGSLVNYAKGLMTMAGELNDLSLRMNVSTDRLQKWGFAAQQGGSSLQDVSQAVRFLNLEMNKALGSGPDSRKSLETLKAMGVTFEQIKSGNVGEAFERIADSVGKMGSSPTMVRNMQEVFGRGSMSLMAAFKEGWRDNMARAPIISAVDIQKLDEAEKSLSRISLQLKVMSVPILTRSIDSIRLAIAMFEATIAGFDARIRNIKATYMVSGGGLRGLITAIAAPADTAFQKGYDASIGGFFKAQDREKAAIDAKIAKQGQTTPGTPELGGGRGKGAGVSSDAMSRIGLFVGGAPGAGHRVEQLQQIQVNQFSQMLTVMRSIALGLR